MSEPLRIALLTHANAEREGVRPLSAAGRAEATHAGQRLAELLESRKWPAVTVFGTAPVFRCVETLLICASQLPPTAKDNSARDYSVMLFAELAERAGQGLSAERLLSAVREPPGGTVLMVVQGDLPSALSSEIRANLNPEELDSSANVTYFVRRPVLCMLLVGEPYNLAAGTMEACDAVDEAGSAQSLLRSQK
jgi:hypothetical protein